MDADSIAEALSWCDGTALIEQHDATLRSAAESALVATASGEIAEIVDRLPATAVRRVTRAPEVTRRLLFGDSDEREVAGFIADAVRVEGMLAGVAPPPASATWSALGDVRVTPDGTTTWWHRLPDDLDLPLDFGSPWAARIDLSGRNELSDESRPSFTDGDVRSIARRVGRTMEQLAQVSPSLLGFVVQATTVLVLQIDPAARTHVASGSNGRYVGRSFLTNPDLPEATSECLAEGIVHEAVHGLLYRECLRRPWVRGDAAVEIPRIESPWTGRALPVRPFLEAACVWFGLAQFWALAAHHGVFDRAVVRERLIRSVSGFARGSLVDRVSPWHDEVRPDVLQAVAGLQERIDEALAGAA